VILSFIWSVCIIHESVTLVYVSSMRDYAQNTQRLSVLMRQNWFETVHVHCRPTFILRMNNARITFIVERKCLYVEHSRSVRVLTRSANDSCEGCASNIRGILHRICLYASTCAIFK